jgi:hypothetical protein
MLVVVDKVDKLLGCDLITIEFETLVYQETRQFIKTAKRLPLRHMVLQSKLPNK